MNSDGTDRHCITPKQARSESPAWSPTGKEIAFVRWDYSGGEGSDIETDIHLIGSDGTDERAIAVTLGEDFDDPAWSPNGEQIVFVEQPRRTSDREDFELYVMDADGSDVQSSGGSAEWDYWPDSSPDGEQILFTRVGRGGDLFDVWVMNSDGSDPRPPLSVLR